MQYRIELKNSVLKDIRRIPQGMLLRIREAIESLAENPLPTKSKKIQGYDDYYRIRIGQYRVVYHIGKKIRIITIIKIGHRKDVYK
jgi:mRNA interferase RelE/StbE